MIVLAGCLAFAIFPASQAPQRRSLVNIISSTPRTCFFSTSFCRFLILACPSLRCYNQHSVARARKHVATCGPSEKSTIYRSPFLTPRKTMELSLTIETRQPYLPKSTTRSRSQSIDTDIRLYPRDSTNLTLSIYWSREIATLPRPNTFFYLYQRM